MVMVHTSKNLEVVKFLWGATRLRVPGGNGLGTWLQQQQFLMSTSFQQYNQDLFNFWDRTFLRRLRDSGTGLGNL